MTAHDPCRRLVAEALGTAFLLATVVGSGIMGERLADGNVALALLANTIPTGAILVVLILMLSTTARTGPGQWVGEIVATFGLVAAIIACMRLRPAVVAPAVGLYITAAYWFTSSTSFANPAVTIARSFSDTFAGIRPADAPAFVAAQCVGAILATWLIGWLVRPATQPRSGEVAITGQAAE